MVMGAFLARGFPHPGSRSQEPAAVAGDETTGLKCVAWERVEGEGLRVDRVNFASNCTSAWEGSAAVDLDRGVALRVTPPDVIC